MADNYAERGKRRATNAMLAAQYAENPQQLPPGYDFDAAPLSPALMALAAQRGQPGVIQKTLGLIPGFDQDGKRGAQSWGNALMSTAQFPIDAVAGIGQALTAPARAYRGEFDPVSEEGIGEALNVAGNAMLGGFAAPKPAGVVGSAGGSLKGGAALGAIPDTPGVRAYSGSKADFKGSYTRAPWASSDPNVANTYARSQIMEILNDAPYYPTGSTVSPMEFRFRNPMIADGNGNSWRGVTLPDGNLATIHQAYDTAKAKGHDGMIVRNVRDGADSTELQGGRTPSDVYAAIDRGTVYSPLTGDLLYANGGLGGTALNALLQSYGLGAPQPVPASPRYRPGDA